MNDPPPTVDRARPEPPGPTRSVAAHALLEVEDLCTYIDTARGTVRAVDGVTFCLDRHEKIAIVGESGSGKSITALSIVRLLPTSAARIVHGQIRYDGCEITTASERELRRIRGKRIGMIFQDPMTSLNPLLKIELQIGEVVRTHLDSSKHEARARALELLERVQVPRAQRVLQQYPHELSGGMRQRVALAMALACRPELIIADEPTTALDVTVQAEVIALLEELAREEGCAVIFISHDLNLVAEFADRILVMYAGRIVESGTTAAVYEDARHPYTGDLIGSIPKLRESRRTRLATIVGQPPDLADLPSGCSYHPRCRSAIERCRQDRPPLETVGAPDHHAACWLAESIGRVP